MPLYEFELCLAETGETLGVICLPLPVEARNAVRLRRKAVPETLSIGGAARNRATPGRQVLETYGRLERRIGNNAEFRRRIGHAPETVRRAWAEPD